MEHVYETLKTAFDNVGSVDDVDKMLFYGGDGGNLVSVQTQCVALTSRIRTAPTKFEVLSSTASTTWKASRCPYNRTGEAVYKITLKGLTDTTRDAGDRLFQWYREKAGVLATGATAGSPGTWTPGRVGRTANLAGMGPIIATPLTAWTTGQHMLLGDGSRRQLERRRRGSIFRRPGPRQARRVPTLRRARVRHRVSVGWRASRPARPRRGRSVSTCSCATG